MRKSKHLLLYATFFFYSIVVMEYPIFVYSGRPAPVQINKCCRIGEYLDRSKTCVAGGSEKWVPKIYLIARKTYYEPKGEAPKFFKTQESTLPKTCQEPELFIGSNNINILSNGSLYLSENSVFISPENYCAEKDSALVCSPQVHGVDSLRAPKKLSKIHKCCGPKSAYEAGNGTCIFFNDPQHPLYEAKIVNSSAVDIVFGFPECNIHYAIAGKFQPEYFDEKKGSLILDSGKTLESNEYCLEHTIENSSINLAYVSIFTCSDLFPVPTFHPADPNSDQNEKNDVQYTLYSIGLLISVIFLSATLAAGFMMPSNHHVLHWRCQTYYIACLLVGDLLLAISQIFGKNIKGVPCVSIAIFMHFFFLAAFFWLNTMCFNIWWTFRDFRPTSLEKGQELFRLRIYRIYAWGVPLLISGIAAILDHIPEGPDDKFLRPHFGKTKCWFYADMEIFTYFFGPIGILLFINLLLFASTARQLTCGLWKRDDVKSTTERAALGRVCLKLVIVMGITWVTDIISWAVGGPQYFWYLTDFINALQGVFIFIVVGCQPQVWSAAKRVWSLKTGRGVTNTTNGPQHSSSSHGLPSIGESVTNNTLTNTTSTKVPMETIC